MAKANRTRLPAIIQHGWHVLPHVVVDAYNEELKDGDGFLGDRASKGAFRDILDRWRGEVARHGDDPFGDTPTWALTKSQLDKHLEGDDAVAAGLVRWRNSRASWRPWLAGSWRSTNGRIPSTS